MNIQRLQEDALSAAVKGNWTVAIEKNKLILENNLNDLSAHLRLGYAYLQTNDLGEAKKFYLKALEIQPANHIARTNLDKIKILITEKSSIDHSDKSNIHINPNLFLNIIGKTKVVELLNEGEAAVIARLKVGQEVCYKIKKRRIEIRDKKNNYIGIAPDDISKRLIFFIEEGSDYSIYIKEATKSSVLVFVKEEKKGKNVQKYTSFPKNIQDDLKLMQQDEGDDQEKEEHEGNEDETEGEAPIDFEQLAEEASNPDYFSDVDVSLEDEPEEEFEE